MKKQWIWLAAAIFLLVFVECSKSKSKLLQQPASMSNYNDLWKKIEKADADQLPKTAIEIIDTIYTKAKTENNTIQKIKAQLHKAKYMGQLDEEGVVKSIQWLESENNVEADPIVRSVMHSHLAGLYANYLESKIWELRGRTEITHETTSDDLNAWSVADFLKKIRFHYNESVKERALQTANVKDYQEILTDEKNTDMLRPTLYDVLAHRAIDYYINTNSDIDQSLNDLILDQPELFAHTDEFLKLKWADTSSSAIKALVLFQNIENFHRKDNDKQAWIDAVQKRLQYVYSHFTGSDKEAMYESALNNWIRLSQSDKLAAPFLLNKANLYKQQAYTIPENGTDTIYKNRLQEALAIYEAIIVTYKNTNEAVHAANAIKEIKRPFLQAQVEKVNVRDKAFRLYVQYKNIPKVFVRVIPVSDAMRKEIYGRNQEQSLQELIRTQPTFEFQSVLPGIADLQQHAVELKIDGISKAGMYAFILSDDINFRWKQDNMAILYTHVSNIAWVHSFNNYYSPKIGSDKSVDKNIIILDRMNGAPLAQSKVTMYEHKYDPSRQNYTWETIFTDQSDAEGKVNRKLPTNKSYTLKIERGDDVLWLDDAFADHSGYYDKPRDFTDVLFFLDRSVYRPGQTVFFKGLMLHKSPNGKAEIIKNKKVQVKLVDANGQEQAVKSFVTNDYGSFNGSFMTPASGLLGSMSLLADVENGSSVSFQVEEYKRPKFEIVFDTNKVISRLNESIIVAGLAKNFAGNVVDQANVKFKVTRIPYYRPMPWWGWKGYIYYPQSSPQIIHQGNTTTDAAGKFTIAFTAKAPTTINIGKDDISYTFNVEVDITDFTGETRSQSQSIRIGTRNLILSSDLNKNEESDSLKEILIKATDLNDVSVQAKGKILIQKLKEPTTTYRDRYWETPDQFVFSESDYHKHFPLDIYKNENQITEWPVESSILNSDFEAGRVVVLNKNLAPGAYKLIATSLDSYRQESKYETFFWVIDTKNKLFPSIFQLFAWQDKSLLIPNQPMHYSLTVRQSPQYIYQTGSLPKMDKWITNTSVINDQAILQEVNRGENHSINWWMVRDNRVYMQGIYFGIDWSNKNLDIQTSTFRDKLLPGIHEEWKLKIAGRDKEKFVAEVVAAMYDKSLDDLFHHEWRRDIFHMNALPSLQYTAIGFAAQGSHYVYAPYEQYESIESVLYRNLNNFGFDMYGNFMLNEVMPTRAGGRVMKSERNAMPQATDMMATEAAPPTPPAQTGKVAMDENSTSSDAVKNQSTIQPRKNLNETVFFFPDIKTDTDGNFILKFKMNEALTKWRLMLFGHTQDLKSGYAEKEIQTQKDLMVFPNAPRFLRQNDELEIPAKVSNLSTKTISGNARLELFDPMTSKALNNEFQLSAISSQFVIQTGQSAPLAWKIKVPDAYTGMVGYRVIADAGDVSDGEENVIPVLTNRMLVTETMPFNVRAKQSKNFVFEEFKNKTSSTSLKHQGFTLEVTSNPAWYAIQSMPYLMEYPHECSEQIVNRLFANSLAYKIIETNPKIKNVFDAWVKKDALKSPLQKNQELKSAILEETPWVRDALNEAEQQKMIAQLFDFNRMASEKQKAIDQLRNRQLSNGGFPWFEGRDDWYITQYIIEDLGHLKKLGVEIPELDDVLAKAVAYCDREVIKYYEEMRKLMKKDDIGLSEIALHYLYARSFYKEIEIEDKKAFTYFLAESEKQWAKQSLYNQAISALVLHRWKSGSAIPMKVLKSLDEKAQHKDDLGMYWKFESGYRYFEMPIETQALIIEAYSEIANDKDKVDEQRMWLLKNKQTNRWSNTKATASAIYALMVNGSSNWIDDTTLPVVKLGGEIENSTTENSIPGLGYFKIKKEAVEIKPSLANLEIKNNSNHILWGSAYWQYFEDLNKITAFKTMPIKLSKTLYKESTEGNKLSLQPATSYHVGDKLVVRIELKVDRPMDYLHLKDMHASGLEPLNVISQYKYKSGLSYYESTKDVATHFFIDHIGAGTFVLEYPLRATQKGVFSNGISSIQCMYAPEFTAHGSGETVSIK